MFKNLMVYNMGDDLSINVEALNNAMANFTFRPCGGMDLKSSGWVAPLKGSEEVCYFSNGQILLNILTEEKILPSAVIKEFVEEKIERFEEREGRKPKKAEKDTFKDEVIQELLPRAFSKYNKTAIWINNDKKLIMVEAGSSKKAEDALALLRKTLGSLPVTPFASNFPIELTLTEWVKESKPAEGFTIMDEAELKAILEDGGVIQSKKQDLASEEIQNHIEAGKQVTKLALNWKESVDFVFPVDASIKRIKLSDTVKEQNSDIDADDHAQRFDADFVLYTGTLTDLIIELKKVFSSEEEESEEE